MKNDYRKVLYTRLRKSMVQLITGEWWISMTYCRTRETYLCMLVMILGGLIIAAPVMACETPTPTPTKSFSCPQSTWAVKYENLTAADGELVGCMAITNDNTYLSVNISSSPSVQMTMANWTWIVATKGDSILHDPNGVPLTQVFKYSHFFKEGEQFHNFVPVGISDELSQDVASIWVSAYATVEKKNGNACTWISSNGTETYTAYNNPKLGPDVKGTPSPRSGTAVMAYISPWHNPSLYFATNRTPFTFTVGKWIWESNKVKNPWKGDIVDFTKTFTVSGVPVSGKLWITADDGYNVSLNGRNVGIEGLNNGWRTYPSNLMYAYVPGHGLWKSVEEYDLNKTPGTLKEGTNTLFIQTANRYMGCDNYLPRGVTATDSDYPTDSESGSPVLVTGGDLVGCGGSCAEPKGTTSTNIGALIFEAQICTAASSTKDAWVLSTDPALNVNGEPAKFFEYVLTKVTVSLTPFPANVPLPQTDLNMTVTVTTNSGPVPDALLVFTTNFGTFSGNGQEAAAKTDGNGMATVTISSSAPGKATLTAWIDANNNSKLDDGEWTATTTVKWQKATTIDLEASPPTIQLPDPAPITLTAFVYDQNKENMSHAPVTFNTTLGSIIGTNPVMTDEDGLAIITINSTDAGDAIITATSGDAKSTPLTVTWLAAPKVTSLTLSPESATLPLHSPTSQLITATILDQNGKPMSGIPVTFTILFGSGSKQSTTVNTENNGQAGVTVTSSVADTATITATSGDVASAPVTVIWLEAPQLALAATPDPTPEPSPEPTLAATPDPTPEPSPEPTLAATPDPTPEPSPEPTLAATPDPTPEPSPEPTLAATPDPTPEPSPEPTPVPEPAPGQG
jgi:hypothetical protein